jgi:hypothetical protein
LVHYWTANDPPETRQAQIEDWLESLEDFAADAIEWACREWRETLFRRPTIADIRKLAIERANWQKRPALPPRSPRKKVLNTWEPGYEARYQEEWFLALPLETKQKFYEQDLERAETWRRVEKGELPEEAFLECCRRQALFYNG